MEKKAKVVMLPTEKASHLTYHNKRWKSEGGKIVEPSLTFCNPPIGKSDSDTPYHLYVISDDEIKELS